MRVVVLVDGEHYPPVVRSAIGHIRARGDDVVAAVFLGGTEKVREGELAAAYGVAVEHGGPTREDLLDRVLASTGPDAVLDLSDDPVVSAADRFRLATVALAHGASYLGADFELRPPAFEPVLTKDSVRVIATGKRTGKTAVAGALARHAVGRGRRPVIVAMGRGGPEQPVVLEAPPGAGSLLRWADEGRHAASDYIEDAITSRVTTIGCRRVGGGLAGRVFQSNVVAGAHIAQAREEDLVILEGSGAAVPPVAARAGIVCVPAWLAPDALAGYLVAYRLLLANLAIVTMTEEVAPAAELELTIRRFSPSIDVVQTAFRPKPLGEVSDRRVCFATTAPPRCASVLRSHLEEVYGCEVVHMTHALADRKRLEIELDTAPGYDVLVTEVKAAAVDVAVRIAAGRGIDVVFADNELVGDGIGEAFDRLLTLAAAHG